MSTLETLRAARELISDEERWTKDVYARDADGEEVPPTDEDAVCFCAMGACAKVANAEAVGVFEGEFTGLPSIVYQTNDEGTHADVLALFDRAIAAEEAKASS